MNVREKAVLRHAKLRVTARGRKQGVLADVRLTSPSGRTMIELGEQRTERGARVSVPADEAGLWTVEIRPREDTTGACALKVKL